MKIKTLLPIVLIGSGLFLQACSWTTYQDESGHTRIKPEYEKGARIIYKDGTYDRDHRYNSFRPHPEAIMPDGTPARYND